MNHDIIIQYRYPKSTEFSTLYNRAAERNELYTYELIHDIVCTIPYVLSEVCFLERYRFDFSRNRPFLTSSYEIMSFVPGFFCRSMPKLFL